LKIGLAVTGQPFAIVDFKQWRRNRIVQVIYMHADALILKNVKPNAIQKRSRYGQAKHLHQLSSAD
jgi:hypothetical protein